MLISIIILATLSVLLVGVIPASVIGLRAAGQRAQASSLARQTLEGVYRDGFGLVGAVGSVRDYPSLVANGTEYTVQLKVLTAGLDDALARNVQVTVRWRSHVGQHTQDSQKEFQALMTLYKQY